MGGGVRKGQGRTPPRSRRHMIFEIRQEGHRKFHWTHIEWKSQGSRGRKIVPHRATITSVMEEKY